VAELPVGPPSEARGSSSASLEPRCALLWVTLLGGPPRDPRLRSVTRFPYLLLLMIWLLAPH